MKSYLYRYLAAILMATSISAIANPCDDGGIGGTGVNLGNGIGGTGITQDDGGIGGTGIVGDSSGIGGTGIHGVGGTGIVGVITGFGSICVNGLEVNFDSNTPVKLDGEQIHSDALAIGHVVAVEATGKGQSLMAKEIRAYHQMTGPITEVNAANGSLKVLGQKISMPSGKLSGLKVGQWLNVSGIRQADGTVRATRLDPTAPQSTVQAIGSLTRQGNKIYLNGVQVDSVSKLLESNNDVRVKGTWDGKALSIKEVSQGPVSDVLQKVNTFHLQGVAGNGANKGHLSIGNQSISITDKTKITGNNSGKNVIGNVVIVRGQINDGKATAQSVEIKPLSIDTKKPVATHAKPLANNKAPHRHNEVFNDLKSIETDLPEKIEHPEQLEKTELPEVEKAEKFEKNERAEKVEKIERAEKIEHPEKIERVEKSEKIERPEKVEKIEKIERPEKIEKPEKVERPEKVEKPEKIELPEIHH